MKYNSFVVEGSAEKAILDILYEQDLLVFEKDEILTNSQGEIAFVGFSTTKYDAQFFSHGFDDDDDDITIHILSDNGNKVKFSADRMEQCSFSYYVTRPEIEMICICSKEKWAIDFEKSKNNFKKPSEYMKNKVGIKNIKRYRIVYDMFNSDIEAMLRGIKIVKRRTHKNDLQIYNLINWQKVQNKFGQIS